MINKGEVGWRRISGLGGKGLEKIKGLRCLLAFDGTSHLPQGA